MRFNSSRRSIHLNPNTLKMKKTTPTNAAAINGFRTSPLQGAMKALYATPVPTATRVPTIDNTTIRAVRFRAMTQFPLWQMNRCEV
jgi:hypothetical protein